MSNHGGRINEEIPKNKGTLNKNRANKNKLTSLNIKIVIKSQKKRRKQKLSEGEEREEKI